MVTPNRDFVVEVVERLLWIAACIALPVLWGVIVHRVFERLRTRNRSDDDPGFPEYQI